MADTYDLQPVLDAAQNQLGLTFSTSDSLDNKALATLGFDVAVGIFGLQSTLHQSAWIVIPVFAILLASVSLALYTALPRDYIGAVINLDEHPEYFEFTSDELVLQLLADTQEAIISNARLNTKKTVLCKAAVFVSLLATLGIVGCIL